MQTELACLHDRFLYQLLKDSFKITSVVPQKTSGHLIYQLLMSKLKASFQVLFKGKDNLSFVYHIQGTCIKYKKLFQNLYVAQKKHLFQYILSNKKRKLLKISGLFSKAFVVH